MNDNFIKEDFHNWMRYGINAIPDFERIISANFKLTPDAVMKYVNGTSYPHPLVMDKMIEWIEGQKKNN